MKYLAKDDAVAVLEIIHDSLSCACEEDLKRLHERLCELMPFAFSVYEPGKRDPNSGSAGSPMTGPNRRSKKSSDPETRNARGKRGSRRKHSLQTSPTRDPRSEVILELVVPHLRQARERIIHTVREGKILLSPKEREILAWMRQGKSTWDMAVLLGITERTVKFHISNIMTKLDAMSRTHAIAIAIEKGLVDTCG